MKKLITLLFVLYFALNVNAQDIKEKKLYEVPKSQTYSLYDLRYDVKSGTYIYAPYDTVTQKTKIISNKGNSDTYTYINSYDVVFDKNGNYYTSAFNPVNETTNTYYFLKNGKSLMQFNNITYPISVRDDGVYFVANDGTKDFRVKYNFNTDNFEYGNKYDTIYLSASKPYAGEGEPMYEIGFTKTGLDYYIACKDGKQMLVVGNTEMSAYDEIYNRYTQEDSFGNIYYIAKETSDNKNYYSLVSGDKKYKKFPFVSTPLIFDTDNNPVYCGSDELVEYPQGQFIVKGDDVVSRKFTTGIYEITLTPSGKIAYIGADTLSDGTVTNTLFIDGKEIITSSSIMGIMFNKSDVPYYTSMDKDNNSFLMEGGKVISDKYSYISDIKFSKNNKISYMGTIYGDYDKNIPNKSYYIYNNKKYGPYSEIASYEGQASNSLTNDKGDFAFVAGKSIKQKGEEYPLTKYYLVSNDWKSDEVDYISNLSSYKNDFYYLAGKMDSKGNDANILYKNDENLSSDYEVITDLKIDSPKGIITFLGQKKNQIYFVEIKL